MHCSHTRCSPSAVIPAPFDFEVNLQCETDVPTGFVQRLAADVDAVEPISFSLVRETNTHNRIDFTVAYSGDCVPYWARTAFLMAVIWSFSPLGPS